MEENSSTISTKQCSNVVVIIGNGFDLSMDLKTSYQDFVNSRYFKFIIGQDNSLIEDKEITDFETNKDGMVLSNNGLAQWIQEVQSIQNWVDLEVELGNYCKDNGRDRDAKTIRKELFTLRYFLYKYLQYEINRVLSSFVNMTDYVGYIFLEQLLNHQGTFNIWDFNYTFTCQNIMHAISQEVGGFPKFLHFPHGHLKDCMYKETAAIVIGTENDSTIMQKCPFAIKSNNEGYFEHRRNLQKQLDNADALIIYGHSMGKTDSDYFLDTLRNSNKLKKVLIVSKNIDSVGEVLSNIDRMSDGVFMDRITRGEIECFNFTLPANRIIRDQQKYELVQKIEKCFSIESCD